MFLRTAALTMIVMTTALSPLRAEQKAARFDLEAVGEVQVAADGHVSDYRLTTTLAPQVAALVDRNVRSWHFEPIVVDGAPVVAKTAMRLRLEAEPRGKDDYTVRIASIGFGEPHLIGTSKPPKYPPDAVHARLGAKVLVAASLDENGRVVDARPYQTSLDAQAQSEVVAEKWRRLFEKSSLAAVENWRYDPSETINGRKTATHVLIPVVYSIETRSKPADSSLWKAYVPGPVHPAPWMATSRVASADADTSDAAVALDSRFRLTSDVIGKTL